MRFYIARRPAVYESGAGIASKLNSFSVAEQLGRFVAFDNEKRREKRFPLEIEASNAEERPLRPRICAFCSARIAGFCVSAFLSPPCTSLIHTISRSAWCSSAYPRLLLPRALHHPLPRPSPVVRLLFYIKIRALKTRRYTKSTLAVTASFVFSFFPFFPFFPFPFHYLCISTLFLLDFANPRLDRRKILGCSRGKIVEPCATFVFQLGEVTIPSASRKLLITRRPNNLTLFEHTFTWLRSANFSSVALGESETYSSRCENEEFVRQKRPISDRSKRRCNNEIPDRDHNTRIFEKPSCYFSFLLILFQLFRFSIPFLRLLP